MSFFDKNHIFFEAWGYAVSYIEFFGLISGVVAVVLSAMANVWSWPVGIINVVLSFFLFFQVQLYPDMFLQVFFFVTNLIGWWRWLHPNQGEEDRRNELRVSYMRLSQLAITVGTSLVGTILLGLFASNLHALFPVIFAKPSAAPFLDSFITVMSIVTTFYMIQKKIESWIIWVVVDMIATYLYYVRDIKLYSLLYFVLTVVAVYGFWHWRREFKTYQHSVS
jgi:nicotinamide mononucleotide transporter